MTERHKIFLAAMFSGSVVFLVYLPALSNGFVNWDDSLYVHENYGIHKIGPDFLQWVFSTPIGGNWHPLTIISLAIDYQVWGLDPFGYHLVNNLLHGLNASLFTLLVIIIYKRIYPKADSRTLLIGGLLASLLWGLHPQRVESVAWVSERKDVLSTLFYLASLIAYIKFRDTRSRPAYILAFAFFLFALMSKAMAISLPVVMVITDFVLVHENRRARALVMDKIPFFLAAALMALLTIWSQAEAGAVTTWAFDLSLRVLNAVRSCGFYVYKMFVPAGLAPYYPFMPDIPLKDVILSSGLLLTISVASIWAFMKGSRYFLAAWLYFLVTVAPVIGIIQVGAQSAADRYTYLPSLSLFMAVGIGLAHLLQERAKARKIIAAVSIAVTITISFLTVKQIGVWNDAITLWSHEIKHYPVVFAYMYRAPLYYNAKMYREAAEDYSVILGSLKEKTTLSEMHMQRGRAFQAMGKFRQAQDDYSAAISLNPRNVSAYNNRANVYKGLGEYGLAIRDFQSAISAGGDHPVVFFNLGRTYLEMGDMAAGMLMIEKADAMGLKAARDFLNRQ